MLSGTDTIQISNDIQPHSLEHKWEITNFFNAPSGLQTSQDARFYALSNKFTPFSNKDKPLVIQFSVKHEQNIDCGGGYLKIFDCKLDQKDMHGESPYEIMFGPDICGPGTKKVSRVVQAHNSRNFWQMRTLRAR